MLHFNYSNYPYKYIWKSYYWKGDIYGEEIYQTVWKKCQLYTDEKENQATEENWTFETGYVIPFREVWKRARGRKMENCILLPAAREEYRDKM